ncbi:vWA domain-containing protein [Marinospirillum perlucidum]|uniref:vWA domain-containing protein n=1 Tax=Marinospirillum perlucidum TaxID=1982602 RepID=UPI000DF3F7F9|nr:VWA domain-containing protein [Marinospirillum perlucidum]
MDTSANLILAWPWALLLAFLPWISQRLLAYLGLKTRSAAALKLPGQPLTTPSSLSWQSWRTRLSPWYGLWLLLVLALARPEWQGQEIEFPQQSRELMLAVDVSGSMQEILDGRTRLDQVKSVVEDFVRQRSQDELGLVVFGAQAYLYVPKTRDHQLLLQQLDTLRPNMAGQGTAIGDALGVSLQALEESQGEPAILLLTDGANNAGLLSPPEALQMASAAGVRTHLVVVSLNPEASLTESVHSTGGEVFSAFSRRELAEVYQHLDELEPATVIRRFSPAIPLGPWLVLIGLLGSGWLLRDSLRRRWYV